MVLFSFLSLCVVSAHAAQLLNVHLLNGNGTHYGNPFDGPCLPDETAIKDRGGSIVCTLLVPALICVRRLFLVFRPCCARVDVCSVQPSAVLATPNAPRTHPRLCKLTD